MQKFKECKHQYLRFLSALCLAITSIISLSSRFNLLFPFYESLYSFALMETIVLFLSRTDVFLTQSQHFTCLLRPFNSNLNSFSVQRTRLERTWREGFILFFKAKYLDEEVLLYLFILRASDWTCPSVLVGILALMSTQFLPYLLYILANVASSFSVQTMFPFFSSYFLR